ELVVREPVLPRRSVDADDPEPAEIALLVLAVAVRVMKRVLDLLLRVAIRGLLEPPVALRLGKNFAALLARVDGTLDAWHPSAPPQHLLDRLLVARRDRLALPPPLPLPWAALHQVARRRSPVAPAAHQLARRAQLEPLLRPAVCLHLWHRLLQLLRSSSARAPSPCSARPAAAETRPGRSPSRPPPGASGGLGRAPGGTARVRGT